MNKAELSKILLDQIPEGHHVVAAVMTTYTIELDFLELDVVPLLLPGQIAFSANEQVKHFQVGEALREYDLKLEVFCDETMFNAGERRSPQLDYLCHPVNLGNKAFHPKVIWLLCRPDDTEVEDSSARLLMAVGSNNLTQAGWWENLEIQHWETLQPGTQTAEFLAQVRNDLSYLNRLRGQTDNSSTWIPEHRDALGEILNFVTELETVTGAQDSSVWYCGFAPENPRSVPDFLRDHLPREEAETLEIVSPFFAEDQDNQLEQSLCSFREAHLMLPVEGDEKHHQALCYGDYLYNIRKRDNVHWCQWVEGQPTLTPDNTLRTLHAKLFHFQYPTESWLFVGSVNFTYKALHDNAEAAFLLKGPRMAPLLQPFQEELPDVVEDELEHAPGADPREFAAAPSVSVKVSFDWQTGAGRLLLQRDETLVAQPLRLRLRDDAENLIQQFDDVTEDEISIQPEDSGPLSKHLKNSGFLTCCIDPDSINSDPEGWRQDVLVQQLNQSFKPRQRPVLTVQEILAIYAGLPEQKRQNLLQQAQTKLILQQYGSSEYAESDNDKNPYREFFCEYAQIFESFTALQRNLDRYNAEGKGHQIDYYLTAPGVDSLPSLIKAASRSTEADFENDSSEIGAVQETTTPALAGVSAYLILLSARQLLRQYEQHPGVSSMMKDVQHELTRIKTNGRIRIEEQAINGRQDNNRAERFFQWFETMFDMPVQAGSTEEVSPS